MDETEAGSSEGPSTTRAEAPDELVSLLIGLIGSSSLTCSTLPFGSFLTACALFGMLAFFSGGAAAERPRASPLALVRAAACRAACCCCCNAALPRPPLR